MLVEDPAPHTQGALSKAIFGNAHFSRVVGYLDEHHEGTVTVRTAARATGLADAIVEPIFRRLAFVGAISEAPTVAGRNFRVDTDSLEPLTRATTWITTKAELELADVETRLWELAERDLGAEAVAVLRKLAANEPSEQRLDWLADAIIRTTSASADEVREIVSATAAGGRSD